MPLRRKRSSSPLAPPNSPTTPEPATPAPATSGPGIRLRELRILKGQVRIVQLDGAIYVQHQWDAKMIDTIRVKKTEGKKTRDRQPCDPQTEFENATYRMRDGRYGLPVVQVKNAMIAAAHRDTGINKTLVRQAIFFVAEEGILVPLETPGAKMREDVVRVPAKIGNADLRYRPMFEEWAATLRFKYNADLLQLDDIVSLLNLAGFGIGIGEWRPEKDGEWGRFEVDPNSIIANGWTR